MVHNSNTILIVRLSALGDVAMTIPVIYSLAIRYPGWKIKVLTRPFFARLFVNCPDNISFLLFKERHKGITGLMRLIKELHKENIYCVADFHNILRSWIIDLSFLIKGKKVAVVNKKRTERFLITKMSYRMSSPFVLRYERTLARLGLDASPLITRIPSEGNNPVPACPYSKKNEKWIGIAPVARYRNKTYPLDSMKSVVGKLSKIQGFRIFIFGGKEDRPLLEAWGNGNVECIAGTITIEEELSLMSRLDIMVSMDSANMHLASLVGTTVISIWGSTTPACGFLGWKQSTDNAICANLRCQPCSIAGNGKCRWGDYRCMKSITPSQIADKVIELINRRGNP